jgi:hypothetical protein
MLWNYDRRGRNRRSWHIHARGRLCIGMQYKVRGRRSVPQDVDFIILGGRILGEMDIFAGKGRVLVHVYQRRRHLVFEVLTRMNVIKRRLQESPQERSQPENDSNVSHSLH